MHLQPCSSRKAGLQKAIEILKNFGFVGGNVCPCLYVKKSAKGIVHVALYIDDNLMVGIIEAIDNAISAHKHNLKVMEGLLDYLSRKLKFSEDKKRTWFRQPHLTKNMKKTFGKHMQDIWSHKTPGMPKFLIVRPVVDSEKISMEDQWEYWSDVGMLLYLIKHLHPGVAIMTANNGANPAAYKELLCVLKYILDTKNLVLKIEPVSNSKEPWEIICFGDSYYAGYMVSRGSISVFILYILDVPVSWQSKLQKSISLSSS